MSSPTSLYSYVIPMPLYHTCWKETIQHTSQRQLPQRPPFHCARLKPDFKTQVTTKFNAKKKKFQKFIQETIETRCANFEASEEVKLKWTSKEKWKGGTWSRPAVREEHSSGEREAGCLASPEYFMGMLGKRGRFIVCCTSRMNCKVRRI